MNYQEKITKIDEKIKNKELDSAEQDLLQIINDEQIKCIEDDRYIHYSFYYIVFEFSIANTKLIGLI